MKRLAALAPITLPIALFLAYPAVRGAPSQSAARALFYAGLAVRLAAIVRWRRADSRQQDDAAEGVAVMLVVSGAVSAFAQWAHTWPSLHWGLEHWINVATWGIISAWETYCLTRARPGSTSER